MNIRGRISGVNPPPGSGSSHERTYNPPPSVAADPAQQFLLKLTMASPSGSRYRNSRVF